MAKEKVNSPISLIPPPSNLPVQTTCLLLPGGLLFSQYLRVIGKAGSALSPEPRLIAGLAKLYDFGNYSVLTDFVGTPLTALAFEAIASSGVKRALLLSIGGAVSASQNPDTERLAIGDIFLPAGVFCEDGTSRAYEALPQLPVNQGAFAVSLKAAIRRTKQLRIQEGLAYTTDAPYRESSDFVRRLLSKSARMVEMELSILTHLAQRYGVELAAGFVISDLLTEAHWSSGYSDSAFKASLHNLLRIGHTLASQSPSPNSEVVQLMEFPGELRIDKEGRLRHQGEVFTHPGVTAYFFRALRWVDAFSCYVFQFNGRAVRVQADDTPYVIMSLDLAQQTGSFNDFASRAIDLSTLAISEENVIYLPAEISAGNRIHWARLSRVAHQQLFPHIIEEGGAYFLLLGEVRFPIKQLIR